MNASLQIAASFADVGPEWDPLFAAGPAFMTSRAFLEAVAEAALPPGAHPALWLVRDADRRPLLLLPMLSGPGRRLSGLTSLYTTLYQPLPAPGATDAQLREAGRTVGRALRAWPVVTLDALDAEWPGWVPLLAGLGDAGVRHRTFAHFGNWHEPLAGRNWDTYLASRDGTLRETIRRKSRALSRDPSLRIEIVTGGPALPDALAAYEDVYRRSWKTSEPFPAFNAALLTRAAQDGVLHLGVMWSGSIPVAAQYWTLAKGEASVLKLAHDDAHRALSPGTVLTAHMIRAVMVCGATCLDFGRGDDPYKRAWAGHRRQRTGLLLVNPVKVAGLRNLLRHDIGRVLRRLRRPAIKPIM